MAIIIVEGPDFAGKTTLVNRIQKDLNLFSIKSPLPNTLNDILEFAFKTVQLGRGGNIVCDRMSLISEVIYTPILRHQDAKISRDASIDVLFDINPIVVYCNPGLEHLQKVQGEQLEGVAENIERLHDTYESYMGYAKSQSIDVREFNFLKHGETERMIANLRESLDVVGPTDREMVAIEEFHNKFGVGMPMTLSNLEGELRKFRFKFLDEELQEFKDAIEAGDMVTAFDSLIDLNYVLKGSALLMGITPVQWTQGFDAVQSANMKKIRAQSEADSKRGYAGDIVKPVGWKAPEPELKRILGLK